MIQKQKKILAVASAGGHWIELHRIKPAFEGYHVIYVSTDKSNAHDVTDHQFYHIINATRKSFWNFFVMFFQVFKLIKNVRPDAIITTGSAPGLMTIAVGRLFSVKTVWIDSIAGVEKLSTSGKIARYFANLYLVQWEHLAKPDGPFYKGSIL